MSRSVMLAGLLACIVVVGVHPSEAATTTYDFSTDATQAQIATAYPDWLFIAGPPSPDPSTVEVTGGQLRMGGTQLTQFQLRRAPVGAFTLDVELGAFPAAGSFNIGIWIGENSIVFHPGYPGTALRVDGPNGFFNTDIGFTLAGSTMHRFRLVSDGLGLFTITLTDGLTSSNTFTKSFTNAASVGGQLAITRAGGGVGEVRADNFVLTDQSQASADPVLFVSNAPGEISQYTLTGTSLGTFTTIAGQAVGLAVQDQTLYVAEYYPGNRVHSFAADGTPLATLAQGSGPYGTSGMAFDASGNLFVSDQLECTIRKFAPDGTDLGVFAAGLGNPWGLAFDAAGNLYAANRGTNVITKYATNGTPLGVFASTGLFQPIGIAFDAAGNLFVANFGNSTIRKFSSAGADLGIFASSGLSMPTEIAFDDDGNLYVANFGNSSVRLYAVDGTDMGNLVTAGLSQPQGIAIRRNAPTANTAPTANAGQDQTVRPGATVTLNGTGSYDDNTSTNLLQFAWNFSSVPSGSGATLTNANTATPSFVPDQAGTYVAQLVVTDEGGLSSPPAQVTIGENPPPSASAGPDQLVIVNNVVSLTGVGTDSDGETLTYAWAFTGTPSNSAAALASPNLPGTTFVPDQPGVYVAQLTVSDVVGPGAPDSVRITAITATSYAETQIQDASTQILELPPSAVTNRGNQNALTQFLSNAIDALHAGSLSAARQQLQQAISRTDGCALRGAPDGNGPGRDWITSCSGQTAIYQSLLDALTLISE